MVLGLAKAGATIVGVGISDMSETKASVEALGSKFLGIQANLLTLDDLDRIVSKVVDTFKTIDILVNNAGIIRREDSLEFSEKDWDDVMDINLKTVFFLSQKVAKVMKENGGGKIINIASMLSFQGGIRVPSYTASKSGIKGLTMLLANEWGQYNINVNAIAPGYMATNNTKALQADPMRSKEILDRIPLGRWGLPSDLEGPVVFLASSASNYINGYTIAVDGGWLAR
ncbi:MAG: 2-dehydro-3-deoxy-D-gluconate 5-dehydrogenase KduD [Acholeplasmataceae bacterium]